MQTAMKTGVTSERPFLENIIVFCVASIDLGYSYIIQ